MRLERKVGMPIFENGHSHPVGKKMPKEFGHFPLNEFVWKKVEKGVEKNIVFS